MTALFVKDLSEHPDVESLLLERARRGVDRHDEVWEGVLRLSPMPHNDHEILADWLFAVVREQARRHRLGRAGRGGGIREPGTPATGPRANYRGPDVLLVPAAVDRAARPSGWLEDGVRLVIEVRSKGEPWGEKLDFYAARGIAEVLYVDWRTLEVRLWRLADGAYAEVPADAAGRLALATARVALVRAGAEGKETLTALDEDGASVLARYPETD